MKSVHIIGGTLVTLAVLVAAWTLLSPLFIDSVVNEEFPGGVVLDRIPTDEELAQMSQEELDRIEDQVHELAKDMPDTIVEEPMPAAEVATGPELLLSGNFKGADSFHKGSGTAGIYKLDDGSFILRLEDFQVTNGPDLRVVLSGHPNPSSSSQVNQNSIELGKLKGSMGNQNYEIPAGTDLSSFQSVVIYCKPFRVVFSTAPIN